jgi:hypothetical protein
MRLRGEKIGNLASQLLESLKANPGVRVLADDAVVLHDIERIITEDLKAEDALDEEVRQILSKHIDRIHREGLDYAVLFRRTKQQLIRERGLTI